MIDGQGVVIQVDFVYVQFQFVDVGDGLVGEGFVDFYQVDVGDVQFGLLQNFVCCLYWFYVYDFWCIIGYCYCFDLCQDYQFVVVCEFFVVDQQCGVVIGEW